MLLPKFKWHPLLTVQLVERPARKTRAKNTVSQLDRALKIRKAMAELTAKFPLPY
jgi:hypothetical protein